MTKLAVTTLAGAAAMIVAAGSAHAHHSFAMFDLTQHVLIEGDVTEWNYNNPHSWLHIQGLDKNDGVCNAPAIIAEWQSKGWLEKGKHLDSHPAPPPR
jgi:hypothetical protein